MTYTPIPEGFYQSESRLFARFGIRMRGVSAARMYDLLEGMYLMGEIDLSPECQASRRQYRERGYINDLTGLPLHLSQTLPLGALEEIGYYDKRS